MLYNKRLNQIIIISILAVLAVLTLMPFYVTIVMSQKTNSEIINHFWAWPKSFHPEYYTKAFTHIYQYILNSLLVATIAVAGAVFLSSLGGYVFGRLKFGGKNALFVLILSLMMIPAILTLIPAFLWYKEFPFVGGNNWLGVDIGIVNSVDVAADLCNWMNRVHDNLFVEKRDDEEIDHTANF